MQEPGGSDRVEIPRDAFLKRTGQFWKLVVGGLILPIPMALWGFRCLGNIRSDQPTSEFVGCVTVVVAGALLIVSLFASVRCPRCKVRLIKKVVRAPEGANAITAFLSQRSCPSCGYVPAD